MTRFDIRISIKYVKSSILHFNILILLVNFSLPYMQGTQTTSVTNLQTPLDHIKWQAQFPAMVNITMCGFFNIHSVDNTEGLLEKAFG